MRPNIEQIELIVERIDSQLAEMTAQLSVLEGGQVKLQSTDGTGDVFITDEWAEVARRNIAQLQEIRAGVDVLRGGRFTQQLMASMARSA